ncbi:cytochrome P450 72A552-like isoform X1 [Spinacia oleracea]|uniref:Cytochrome P450 72A552-like isoform X1 n=1 Tax=Spinacia oleracea TaxID=3562 RepID=A0A9R0IBL4_SPIOL|nr:cytochrome P450 72A552-like isoform X1 [Spinacia oleracea]
MSVLFAFGSVLLCIVILKWLWKLLNGLWLNPKRLEKCLKQQGLVGNSYKFLIGDMKESSTLRAQALNKPIPFTHDYYQRIQPFTHQILNNSCAGAGKNIYTWLGPVPTILITQPELIKDAFNRMNNFQKPRLNPYTQILSTGLPNYEGQKWAKHRKLLNPAFQLDKLKLMIPAFETCVTDTLNKWEKLVSKTGSSEVDVWPHFTTLTGDGIARAAFGSSFEDGRRIFDLLKEQKDLVISLLKYSYIPGFKYLPTKGNKMMKETENEIKPLLTNLIHKRKKAMEAGEAPKDDLLGMLLESNANEARQVNENESGSRKRQSDITMSFHEMIDACKLFFLAGQETTSVALTWAMILLAKHQDYQTRAREEVLATFGTKTPDFDGVHNRLKIVTTIVHEVLRLYPPIPATSRRAHERETKLGDLVIPQGVGVSFSILHAHLNPEIWGDDAKEFKPERFSEGIAKATKGNNSYFPFGWGPRICIGQAFALIQVKMALSMILQRFSFELSPSYIHAPTSLLALQPQHGAHVILHRL